MFWLPGFCCRNSYLSCLLPHLFLVPQSYLRGYLLGWSPQKDHQIERNSQLLGCAFFFSVNTGMSPSHCGIDVLWPFKVSKGGPLGAPMNPKSQRIFTKIADNVISVRNVLFQGRSECLSESGVQTPSVIRHVGAPNHVTLCPWLGSVV